MAPFLSPSFSDHESVSFHFDKEIGLKAIIAIHDSSLGPALGGLRMFDYKSDEDALEDVLRLSRGMTYKSALARLPLGGGKAVIIGNPKTNKSRELLQKMGEFINSLGGRYITAEDSGTCVDDMKTISTRTKYVSGVMEGSLYGGDPSPLTARGVYSGIKAAVKHKFRTTDLVGKTVAIQGAGAVGLYLAQYLIGAGAIVYVADINPENLAKAESIGASPVRTDKILHMEVDVLAPCAMGAVINDQSIDKIKAKIIAGAANNQLCAPAHGEMLRAKGVLYAPDYVINAGGIIEIHYQRTGGSRVEAEKHIDGIGQTLSEIFLQADAENLSTEDVSRTMAEKIIAESKIKKLVNKSIQKTSF